MNASPEQIDALTEIINIGVGRAGGMLNDMLHSPVKLQVPFIKIVSPAEYKEEIKDLGNDNVAAVQLGFKGAFSGKAELVFPTESASKLVDVVMGDESNNTDLDSVRIGVLMEVGNIVINGVMGSIGNILSKRINYSIPRYSEESIKNSISSDEFDSRITILLVQTRFSIERHHIEGDVILFFEFGSFEILLSAIDDLTQKINKVS